MKVGDKILSCTYSDLVNCTREEITMNPRNIEYVIEDIYYVSDFLSDKSARYVVDNGNLILGELSSMKLN